MEVTGFGRRGKYTTGHIQLWLKVGPIASLARFHVMKTEVSYHVRSEEHTSELQSQ